MEQLFSLTPLIPVFPLLAFALIVLWANKNNRLSAGLAIAGIAISAVISWVVIFATLASGHHVQVEGWSLPVPWLPTGTTVFNIGFAVDGFTAAMLFMVPLVSTLIFIYASEYMEGDSRYARFFAYVSLFVFGMLTLVVADNLLLLFISWEIMGLCSYLLIGFWFEKDSAKKAGLKAFLTTRIGDVLLFAGMLFLYSKTGTLTFREIFEPAVLHQLATTTIWGQPAAVVISLLVFGGAVGKSAQFPLHVWLPDAMEGPTPVSAMIHAATMVSAGVYLVARMLPLFAVVPVAALQWVAIIGSITAFFAATIGLAQNDIKRVLAYSTISQLGYMMIGLGLGGFLAGIFHLLTHSFFKALLFLGSGSVIHAMEHGAHHVGDHHTDPQDMMNMGGLAQRMKKTYIAYMAGTLALAGIVPFAGFFSKDEILADAWHQAGGFNFGSVAFWAWLAGTLGAFVTALYMGRQIGLVFLGKPRTGLSEHAVEPGKRMTYPLLVLGFFALVLGFANVPENVPLIGNGWLHHFAGMVHESAGVLDLEALPLNWGLAGLATVIALTGFFGGIALYRGHQAGQEDPMVKILGRPLFTLLKNKYYVDEFYFAVIINPVIKLADLAAKFDYDWVINPIVNFVGNTGRWISDISAEFDRVVVDGLGVLGTARFFRWMGKELRYTQTGQAQNYLLVIALVSLSLVGVYLFGIGF